MTLDPPPFERRPRRRRRGPGIVRWLVRIALALVLFGVGVAVGQALEERPRSGQPVTNESTIQPWTRTRNEVTVTVTKP